MEERRQYFRKNKSLAVAYQIQKGFLKIGSRSQDVSEAGMRLSVSQRLPPGVALDLEIRPEDSLPILATGEVVWLKERDSFRFPFEAGIRFTEIAPAGRNRIICELLKN
jgi:c-di-GMP-binding flagellar brake protein YcgR